MTPDEPNPQAHHELILGLIEGDSEDIPAMEQMMEIHGQELFEWIEEYMIDNEINGYHKISMDSFVNGIRYFIFYHLMGKEHGKTRVTSDMYRRLVSSEVDMTADEWGAVLDVGDASAEEAIEFEDMIRHGVTEERIENLRLIDYIVEE